MHKLVYLILSTGYLCINGRLAQLVRAPALQAGGHRFESCIAHHFFAEIAQLVEQLTCNQQVTGSSPVFGTIFGEVAKWLNATDCKSVLFEFDGSNPSLSTTLLTLPRSQVVRHQTLTLTCVSSNLTEAAINYFYDLLAQLVEHLTFNQRVWSSNLQRVTMCLSGGIGRRTGLKILRESTLVPVQVRPQAPYGGIPKSG